MKIAIRIHDSLDVDDRTIQDALIESGFQGKTGGYRLNECDAVLVITDGVHAEALDNLLGLVQEFGKKTFVYNVG